MRFEKLFESFAILPTIALHWYYYEGKKYYHLQFAWLFWSISTLKNFKWKE